MEAREAIEARLAELHQQRGAALLQNKQFDNAVIVAEHEKLAALDDVEAEQVRRERQAAAEAAEKERQVKLAQLEAMVGDDLQDVVEAEAGARQLAAALGRMTNKNLQLTKLAADIRLPIPAALGRFELEKRLACLVSAVMSNIGPNHRHRFGATVWFPGIFKADTSWRQVTVRFYETLLGKEIS